jgi:hypothetical protein
MSIGSSMKQLKTLLKEKRLNRAEPIVFFIVVLLNAAVIFSATYFRSLDGPSHIYNAGLISELISGDDTAVPKIYSINKEAIPNWTSHVVLVMLSNVFSPWMAEKLLLVLCCFFFPYAVRALLKSSSNISPAKALLVLPATYSNFVVLGFYNYLIALVVMIYFIRSAYLFYKSPAVKPALVSFALLTLLYFSHPYVFAVAMLVAALSTGFHLLLSIIQRDYLKGFKAVGIMLAIALPYVLMLWFFTKAHTNGQQPSVFIPVNELLHNLYHGYSFVMYQIAPQEVNTFWFVRVWLVLFAAALLVRIYYFRRTKEFLISDAWLLTAVIVGIAYFTLPDDMGGAMNTVRLRFLLTLCALIWIVLQPISRFVWIPAIAVLFYFHIKQLKHHYEGFTDKQYIKEVNELRKAGAQLPPNSITFTFNFSQDMWMFHALNHAGIEGKRALVENYEADSKWFPVVWTPETMVRLAGQEKLIERVDWRNPGNYFVPATVLRADYVLIYEHPKNAADSAWYMPIDSVIQKNYTKIYSGTGTELYKQTNLVTSKR